jgi:hypothetical protein
MLKKEKSFAVLTVSLFFGEPGPRGCAASLQADGGEKWPRRVSMLVLVHVHSRTYASWTKAVALRSGPGFSLACLCAAKACASSSVTSARAARRRSWLACWMVPLRIGVTSGHNRNHRWLRYHDLETQDRRGYRHLPVLSLGLQLFLEDLTAWPRGGRLDTGYLSSLLLPVCVCRSVSATRR